MSTEQIIILLLQGGGILVVWEILRLLYKVFTISKIMKQSGKELGYHMGKLVRRYGLIHIKDAELKQQLIKDLDSSVSEFDSGFDLAIRGLKITDVIEKPIDNTK